MAESAMDKYQNVKALDDIFRQARITAYLYGHMHEASFSLSPEGVAYILSGNAHRVDKHHQENVSKKTLMYNTAETGFVQGVFSPDGFQAEFINGKGVIYYKSPMLKPRTMISSQSEKSSQMNPGKRKRIS